MAGYMVVGKFDCPWFAKAGLIIDALTKQDPTRKFSTEMLGRYEWLEFVDDTQRTRGWNIKNSPVIWEMLMDAEGKGNLIGDIDDFCEYVNLVFGLVIHISTYEIELAVCENKTNFEKEGRSRFAGNATVLNIAIIQSPIRILELLMTQLLSAFPITDPGTLLNIRLYDKKTSSRELQGFLMEVNDMASPTLFKITTCYTANQCLYEAHVVLIMEDFLQEPQENYSEWLNRVEDSVLSYAEAIENEAWTNCKILVGCNGPLCFIAETLRSRISTERVETGYIVTIGQHVVNHGKTELSKKADIPTGRISRLHAWGWPGLTGAWVEVKHGIVGDICGSIQGPLPIYRPITELAQQSYWIVHEFSQYYLALQQKLLSTAVKKMYSDMCIAEAVIATLHVWFESTRITVNENIKRPNPCNNPENPEDELPSKPTVTLPAICVGLECSQKLGLDFPPGIFLVQPAMCYDNRWIPIGKISEYTSQRINMELGKLWMAREAIMEQKSFKQPEDESGTGRKEEYDEYQGDNEYEAEGEDPGIGIGIGMDGAPQQFTPDNNGYNEEEYNELYDQEYNPNYYNNNSNDNFNGKEQYYSNTADNGQDYEEYDMFPPGQQF